MKTDRSKIIQKIRLLLESAADASRTEAEALAFADKAEKLMREYGFAPEALEDEKLAPVYFQSWSTKNMPKTVGTLSMSVGALVGVLVWQNRDELGRAQLALFGDPQKVEVVQYMLHVLQRAGESDWIAFGNSPEGHEVRQRAALFGYRPKNMFLTGWIDRVGTRIEQMIIDRKAYHEQGTGTSLVVVEAAALETARGKWLALVGKHIKTRRVSVTNVRDGRAYRAGYVAGGDVHLGTGVGGKSEPKQLR